MCGGRPRGAPTITTPVYKRRGRVAGSMDEGVIAVSVSRPKYIALATVAVLAVFVAAMGYLWSGGASKAAPQAHSGGHNVPVSTARAAAQNIPVILANIGVVQAYQSVLVRARVDGTLNTINFTEGQLVQAGDLLAVIDPRPYQAALDAAMAKKASDQAGLKNNKKTLGRDAALLQSNFATKQTYDNDTSSVAELQATIAGDDASIAAAKLNLDFTQIRAPISGRVGLRMIDAGNLIHATDATGIVSIAQIQPMSMLFSLPEDDLPAVQTGMQHGALTVFAYAADNQTLLDTGQLLTVDNGIDESTGTFRMKAIFPNLAQRLWPGQTVNARLQVGTLKDAVTVPSTAINRGPNGLFVFMIKPDKTAKMQPVEVAQDDGQNAVISKGLAPGAIVVTDGQSKLQDGTKVAMRGIEAGS